MADPRILADVLHEYFCQSEEPLAIKYRQRISEQPSPSGEGMGEGLTPLEDWLPSHTVERKLGISTRTLQTLRDNGTIPFTRLGGKIYYKRSDIQRILDDAYTMSRLKNPDGYGSIRK